MPAADGVKHVGKVLSEVWTKRDILALQLWSWV
jgi:hypothetical protein